MRLHDAAREAAYAQEALGLLRTHLEGADSLPKRAQEIYYEEIEKSIRRLEKSSRITLTIQQLRNIVEEARPVFSKEIEDVVNRREITPLTPNKIKRIFYAMAQEALSSFYVHIALEARTPRVSLSIFAEVFRFDRGRAKEHDCATREYGTAEGRKVLKSSQRKIDIQTAIELDNIYHRLKETLW